MTTFTLPFLPFLRAYEGFSEKKCTDPFQNLEREKVSKTTELT